MKKNEEDGWWQFISLSTHLKSKKEFQEFFDFFLTIDERKDLGRRLLIVQALLKGELTQREIAEKLGVSISKITRGSNALKTINPSLKELLEDQLL